MTCNVLSVKAAHKNSIYKIKLKTALNAFCFQHILFFLTNKNSETSENRIFSTLVQVSTMERYRRIHSNSKFVNTWVRQANSPEYFDISTVAIIAFILDTRIHFVC